MFFLKKFYFFYGLARFLLVKNQEYNSEAVSKVLNGGSVIAGLTRNPLITNLRFWGGFRVKHGMTGF
jgi:hypothetical protein